MKAKSSQASPSAAPAAKAEASPSTSNIYGETISFVPVVETTEQVCAALTCAFPRHISFTVCRQETQAGVLLQVLWRDGPIEAEVEHVVNAITEGICITRVYVRKVTRQLTVSSADDSWDTPF
jgi:hypothetical protein